MSNDDKFELEKTSVWSFPNRGNWSIHNGGFRGNWSPYVPRNIILRYSSPNSWILDQFAGGGTTIIEALLLNRNVIGLDISEKSINTIKENIKHLEHDVKTCIKKCDATNLDFIKSGKIDLVCTHPPYLDIVKYSDDENDLSNMNLDVFIEKMRLVARESYRVLKKNCVCAVMIGDVRKNGKLIPLGMKTLDIFISEGFNLKEIIIKEQHNCKMTPYWMKRNPKFLILAHEYIFVMCK